MTIPVEIIALVNQLYQEIEQVEQLAIDGLNLIRPILFNLPDNLKLLQAFAFLNSVTLAVSTYRKQISTIVENITPLETTDITIQEAGEDLSTLLGVILEAKIRLSRVIDELKGWES